jgi:hypothetical protein
MAHRKYRGYGTEGLFRQVGSTRVAAWALRGLDGAKIQKGEAGSPLLFELASSDHAITSLLK